MARNDEGEEATGVSRIAAADLARRVERRQVRHRACNARLFDARFPWIETDVLRADIVVKCWRCAAYVALALAPTDT